MRLDLNKKPEGIWCSFNESCGEGDGSTKEFKTPLPSDAVGVLVMCDSAAVAADARFKEINEKDGTILKDEADGYKLETRNISTEFSSEGDPADVARAMRNPPGELWIVFDRARAFKSKVSVSALNRQVGDSFKILPMNTKLQKNIEEKQPQSMKKRDPKAVSLLDLQEYGKLTFGLLVEDWSGMKAECNPENKKLLLEKYDPMVLGGFATERSYALRTESMNSFAKDSSD